MALTKRILGFFKKRQKSVTNSAPLISTLNLYKIHTLKGDTYWIPVDETYRQLGPVVRPSYSGVLLNKDIKVATIIPWHQIDWLQDAGDITI